MVHGSVDHVKSIKDVLLQPRIFSQVVWRSLNETSEVIVKLIKSIKNGWFLGIINWELLFLA